MVLHISSRRGPLVKGPVATIVISSFGREATSSLNTLRFGNDLSFSVIYLANKSRSTDKAFPAGTSDSVAASIIIEDMFFISSFKRPQQFVNCLDFNELEQTSSPNNEVTWAPSSNEGLLS